jgi:hypothetical protein
MENEFCRDTEKIINLAVEYLSLRIGIGLKRMREKKRTPYSANSGGLM